MWSLAILLKHVELAMRLQVAVPWIAPNVAYTHAAAATAAESAQIPAELLLGIAFVESRFDPTAVSRVESGRRRTGSYRQTTAPAGLDPRGSLFCGPLQTFASSWSSCMQMRNLDTGYAAATVELRQWLRDPRVRGNTVRALAGHGCGNFGAKTGVCNGYPERVLTIARQLRRRPVHGQAQRPMVAGT
jgi:hypothetical protein